MTERQRLGREINTWQRYKDFAKRQRLAERQILGRKTKNWQRNKTDREKMICQTGMTSHGDKDLSQKKILNKRYKYLAKRHIIGREQVFS